MSNPSCFPFDEYPGALGRHLQKGLRLGEHEKWEGGGCCEQMHSIELTTCDVGAIDALVMHVFFPFAVNH